MSKTLSSEETDFSAQDRLNAADWVTLIDSDLAKRADPKAFQAWLGADPRHMEDYIAHEKLWNEVGRLAENAQAREILRGPQGRRPAVQRRTFVAAGIALVVAVSAVLVGSIVFTGEHHYRTARGEQLSITLEDGSRIILNTNTQLSVFITKKERRVRVARGQTFITVAKDPARPFRVFAGDTEVRALGTSFDIFSDDRSVRVAMSEGTAAIYSLNAKRSAIDEPPVAVISSGQQITVAATTPARILAIDPRAAGAWRENRIVFDRTLLSDAVQDVNRYRDVPIVIGNPEIADFRVTGAYRIDHLDDFVDALLVSFPVYIQYQNQNGVVLGLKQ